MGKVPVVFIAGSGRSGSTLVERYLANEFGFCGCGELRYFWVRNCLEGDLCACGQKVEQCDFWGDFFKELGIGKSEYAKKVIKVQNQIDYNKYLLSGFKSNLVDDFLSLIVPIYKYAYKRSGCVLIDSSKHPSYLELLTRSDDLKITCLHILRDPVAVAYSWSKKIKRPESQKKAFMPTFSPFRVSIQWITYNLWFSLYRSHFDAYYRLSYDDFCKSPESSLKDLLDSFSAHHVRVRKGMFHSGAGNPTRFRPLTIINPDYEWKQRARGGKYKMVSLLTWPAKWILEMRREI